MTTRATGAATRMRRAALLVVALLCLGGGVVASALGQPSVAHGVWAATTVIGIAPAAVWVVVGIARRTGAVDLMALLALIGTLALREYLAGAIITAMLATGRHLDALAQGRAERSLQALADRTPRTARRLDPQHPAAPPVEVPVDSVVVGDHLVVATGEVIAVDGTVVEGPAVLDESALTGEPALVTHPLDDPVRSGTLNAGAPFTVRATARAADSTYAGIVAMAQAVSTQSAPVVRIADRLAGYFVAVSLAAAGGAWALGGARRAVAVLVVATPCPLLLAVPIAVLSGLARASRRGVVVRNGGALEQLGRVSTVVLDKTGTVTRGRPQLVDVVTAPAVTTDTALRLAASVDQYSRHVLARAIVDAAHHRALTLTPATDIHEQAGVGVTARIGPITVEVGAVIAAEDAPAWASAVVERAALDGATIVWVRVDGDVIAGLALQDVLRSDAARAIRRLRSAGVRRVVLLTGDRPAPAREVGLLLGLDEVFAGQTPADKVQAVRTEQSRATTVMIGDGINDAPALAAADVGAAMGAFGSSAATESADVVLTTDRVDAIADAVEIARRSRRIAIESAGLGMGLSAIAMVTAGAGLLAVTVGAVLQEIIDVLAMLSALRALVAPRQARPLERTTDDLLRRFAGEHEYLRGTLTGVRTAADALATADTPSAIVAAVAAARHAHAVLTDTILPHERAEESELYPALRTSLGVAEATTPMSRVHAEIERLTARLGLQLEQLGTTAEIDAQHRTNLLSCLYGLYAVLTLHFTQEEESYFVLTASPPTASV